MEIIHRSVAVYYFFKGFLITSEAWKLSGVRAKVIDCSRRWTLSLRPRCKATVTRTAWILFWNARWGEDRMRGCHWMNTLIIVRTREWLKMVQGVKKCKLKKLNLWFSLSYEERAVLKWNCCRRDSLNTQESSSVPVNMSVFSSLF